MAIQLGSAYGKVSLDVNGLMNGITKGKMGLQGLLTAGEKVGGALKNIGGAMTVGLTLPIVAVGAASIKAASDLEETKNKVQVIFGDMSSEILKWSQSSAIAMGQSRTQALDAAGNFAIFGKAAGLAGQDLAKFAESNTQLASDLASFFNTSPEEAITAIGAAYRGESEPIRKYGVLLSDAALRQKALEMGIIDSLGPLTQQQRVLAANALILDQTKDAQGDFARTSNGLANSTRILNAQFKDALAMLGQNLLPMALLLVQALNKLLQSMNNLNPTQQKMLIGFAGLLAIMGPVLSVLGTLISTVSTLGGVLSGFSGLGISLGGVGTTISATLVPAIAAVGAALTPVLAFLVLLGLQVSIFALLWRNNFLHVRDAGVAVALALKNVWRALTAFLRGDTEAAGVYLKAAFQAIADHVKSVLGEGMLSNVRNAWASFTSWIGSVLVNIRNYIVNTFTRTDWAMVGKAITWGLANGMLLGLPTLIATAAKVAAAALTQIKASLGISSPSKAFMQLGMYSAQGYQMGLAREMAGDSIARSMSRPVSQLANSQQQNITMQFASGLTMSQVQGMINQNNESLIDQLNRAMGVG